MCVGCHMSDSNILAHKYMSVGTLILHLRSNSFTWDIFTEFLLNVFYRESRHPCFWCFSSSLCVYSILSAAWLYLTVSLVRDLVIVCLFRHWRQQSWRSSELDEGQEARLWGFWTGVYMSRPRYRQRPGCQGSVGTLSTRSHFQGSQPSVVLVVVVLVTFLRKLCQSQSNISS